MESGWPQARYLTVGNRESEDASVCMMSFRWNRLFVVLRCRGGCEIKTYAFCDIDDCVELGVECGFCRKSVDFIRD